MGALALLGLRLIKAGGWIRATSVGVGNAIGTLLVLIGLALPTALVPDPIGLQAELPVMAALVMLLAVPAVVLVVTMGRLSSGARDQRLGALRLLGLSKNHAALVAAIENATLAVIGAVVGAVAFQALASLLNTAITWMPGRLQVSPGIALGVIAGVAAVSALIGAGANWDGELPGSGRAKQRRGRPRAWRAVVLLTGLAALIWAGQLPLMDPQGQPIDVNERPVAQLIVAGSLLTAVGLVIATPLAVSWMGGALVRLRPVSLKLAGRSIQADSTSAGRVVAGLSMAVFIMMAV
ncbi:MAG: hypothetical protein LBH68_05640, partial [Bifidobacteriaceae bacterium]|nr:hypothetical protein [Bifidobacteriaceae bacterium]